MCIRFPGFGLGLDRLEKRYDMERGSPSLPVPWRKQHPGRAAATGLFGLPYHTLTEPVLAGDLRVEAIGSALTWS